MPWSLKKNLLDKYSWEVLIIVRGKFFDRELNYDTFYYEVKTSIWIKKIAQLQFCFTRGSSIRFRLNFDDVMSKNSLLAYEIELSAE